MESEENKPASTETAATAPAVTGSTSPSPAPATMSVSELKPYEFPARLLLNDPELRRVTADYNEILLVLSRRFATLFRAEFDISLASLQTPSFRQFATSHTGLTHFTMFKIEPLRGIGLLQIPQSFALAITNRLMGGAGQPEAADRELTEIEVALFDLFVQLLVQGWCEHWNIGKPLKPMLLGHETDSKYLQTSPAEAPMLLTTLNLHIGEFCSKAQLAIPFSTFDPMLEKLRSELKPPADAVSAAVAPAKAGVWNAAYDDVRATITAQMSGPRLTARDLPRLKVGDLIDLPAESVGDVQLRLGNTTRFTGRLGQCDDKWAVEVIRVLKV